MTWLDVFASDAPADEAEAGESDADRRRRERDEAQAQAQADQEWYDQRREVADHEAGHHIVARELGVTGGNAGINDDLSGFGGGGWFDGEWGGYNDAVVALAGSRACGSDRGASQDFGEVRAGLRESGRSWSEARRDADRILRANRRAFRDASDGLFENGWI